MIAMHAPNAYLAFVLSAYTLYRAISTGEGFVQGVKYRTQGTSNFNLISGDTLIFLLVINPYRRGKFFRKKMWGAFWRHS